QSLVELHSRDGALLEQLTLPAIGTAVGFAGKRTDTETFFQFTNFTTPAAVYRLELKTRRSTIYRQPRLKFNPEEYETTQIFYTSKDGTRVPMFLSHKKGLTRDGMNPTLLYGYGGFNISLRPEFSSANLLWMEMGGIYAQPSLRGGGEYGEAWHKAGTKLAKQNVFDDFIAAAEWLIANRYTSPEKLAISGGSNGGLLVAACEIQRPDLFSAVLPSVGVMDMLRFDKFTIGWAWKTDYGSPSEDEAEFHAIYRYSPLHNLKPGTEYPPTLISTADHDDRVFPAHSFKFAAALQAAQAGTKPVLIRIETRAGHGGGMPLTKRVELVVDQFTFLLRQLKMQPDL
ncbi:MAG TPA: prolyl oligopeptidase family serine peptidase, partial [Edaphobacter sp.]